METDKKLYMVYFRVPDDSGIALVVARNEREAFSCLKSAGYFNANPGVYELNHVKYLDPVCNPEYGLIIECYASGEEYIPE